MTAVADGLSRTAARSGPGTFHEFELRLPTAFAALEHMLQDLRYAARALAAQPLPVLGAAARSASPRRVGTRALLRREAVV